MHRDPPAAKGPTEALHPFLLWNICRDVAGSFLSAIVKALAIAEERGDLFGDYSTALREQSQALLREQQSDPTLRYAEPGQTAEAECVGTEWNDSSALRFAGPDEVFAVVRLVEERAESESREEFRSGRLSIRRRGDNR